MNAIRLNYFSLFMALSFYSYNGLSNNDTKTTPKDTTSINRMKFGYFSLPYKDPTNTDTVGIKLATTERKSSEQVNNPKAGKHTLLSQNASYSPIVQRAFLSLVGANALNDSRQKDGTGYCVDDILNNPGNRVEKLVVTTKGPKEELVDAEDMSRTLPIMIDGNIKKGLAESLDIPGAITLNPHPESESDGNDLPEKLLTTLEKYAAIYNYELESEGGTVPIGERTYTSKDH